MLGMHHRSMRVAGGRTGVRHGVLMGLCRLMPAFRRMGASLFRRLLSKEFRISVGDMMKVLLPQVPPYVVLVDPLVLVYVLHGWFPRGCSRGDMNDVCSQCLLYAVLCRLDLDNFPGFIVCTFVSG